MIKFQVRLNTIDKVKQFCNITSKIIYDVDIIHGRYVIDGKSIMGIFSLDLSNVLDVQIHVEDPNEIDYKELFKDVISTPINLKKE